MLAKKPQRPFGVSLAIAASILLFAVIPILVAGFLLYLSNFTYVDGNDGMSGIQFTNSLTVPLIGLITGGLIFITVSIWCWRGRVRITRFVFQGIVLIYGGILSLSLMQTGRRFPGSVSSGDSFQNIVNNAYLVGCLLLVVYVLWFMNRWSARAFYRGYYTDYDLELLREAGLLLDD
ncbi:MAG: hypothetical protein ACPG7F_17775, partial [Aggregatilineales bacterium]